MKAVVSRWGAKLFPAIFSQLFWCLLCFLHREGQIFSFRITETNKKLNDVNFRTKNCMNDTLGKFFTDIYATAFRQISNSRNNMVIQKSMVTKQHRANIAAQAII